jgi:putative transposase
MPRKPRIEVPAGIYHVGSRGNRGCRIYADDHERKVFLRLFGRLAARHGWKVETYCLMTNHYHLLMRIEDRLSDGMRELNGGFSSYTNARNGLEGHLFENRFWCDLVEGEAHYLQTARYIVLNPIRAGLCASPEDWRWSSYRACVGLEFAPAVSPNRRPIAQLQRRARAGAGGVPAVRQRRPRRCARRDMSRCRTP